MTSTGGDTETRPSWLSPDQMDSARSVLPIVYVDAVPVRVDDRGQVVSVGLLLSAMSDGTISRGVVSGRVLHGERIRAALLRHIEKDLGSLALPRVHQVLEPVGPPLLGIRTRKAGLQVAGVRLAHGIGVRRAGILHAPRQRARDGAGDRHRAVDRLVQVGHRS